MKRFTGKYCSVGNFGCEKKNSYLLVQSVIKFDSLGLRMD